MSVVPLNRRVDALDAEIVDLRRRSDDRIDDRMSTSRREWKAELDARLAAHHDEVDKKLGEHHAALKVSLAETEGRVVAKLDALAGRRQVPPWLESLTARQAVVVSGFVLSTLSGVLALVVPAVLSVIAALQGHPTEYRVPVPVPLQFEGEPSDTP